MATTRAVRSHSTGTSVAPAATMESSTERHVASTSGSRPAQKKASGTPTRRPDRSARGPAGGATLGEECTSRGS